MQRQTHHRPAVPRFHVNTSGELVDRHAQRRSHTGFSMLAQRVTRSELQVLADLLNTPEHAGAYDAGRPPLAIWHARLAEIEASHRAVRAAWCCAAPAQVEVRA